MNGSFVGTSVGGTVGESVGGMVVLCGGKAVGGALRRRRRRIHAKKCSKEEKLLPRDRRGSGAGQWWRDFSAVADRRSRRWPAAGVVTVRIVHAAAVAAAGTYSLVGAAVGAGVGCGREGGNGGKVFVGAGEGRRRV